MINTRWHTFRNRYVRGYVSAIEGLRKRAGTVLGTCAVLIILLGMFAFPLEAAARGDQVTNRESLYNTLGLFAFAGNRFGFPQTHLLQFVYFGAPLLSASALIEAGLRVAADGSSFLLVGLRGHSVVGGMGHLGEIIASHLDMIGDMQVLIDWRADSRTTGEAGGARSLGPHVLVIGDMTHPEVLRRARAQHAGQVFFAAADDLVNIEATERMQALSAGSKKAAPMVYCHVYDDELREGMRDDRRTVAYFNSYRLAAKALVARLFWDGWLDSVRVHDECHLIGTAAGFSLVARPPSPPLYVVVGLGRFGRSVLQELVDATPRGSRFLVVDRDLQRVDAAVGSLPPWRRADVASRDLDATQGGWLGEIPTGVGEAVILFCTDNDRANLALAMRAAKAGHRTLSRMFDQDTGARIQEAYANHREVSVALFRELFRSALPILTHQRHVEVLVGSDGIPTRAARVRSCLRLPGREEHWYLTQLGDSESARMARKVDALRVAGLPWSGESATLPGANLWLLTAADLEHAFKESS